LAPFQRGRVRLAHTTVLIVALVLSLLGAGSNSLDRLSSLPLQRVAFMSPATVTTALPPLPPRPATISKLLAQLLSPLGSFSQPAPTPSELAGPEVAIPEGQDSGLGVPADQAPSPALPAAAEPSGKNSTVKVSGEACGILLNGSGFSPAPNTVLTNAHVVAGVLQPMVLGPDGQSVPARVVMFDPSRDVAVLVAPGLDVPSLPFGSATPPQDATVYGHPFGQDAVAELPVRIEGQFVANVPDIYRTSASPRENLAMTGDIRSGDSGSPTIDAGGSVVGMVFAVEALRPGRAFAIPSQDLVASLGQPRSVNADTGPCLA
ncbi:MAG: trypsin-like peptidase domain-containing protein, partial [Pseudonocardiaceae bacterium]